MSAEVARRRLGPLEDRRWYGFLTTANYEDVAERIRQMLDGKWYTWASTNESLGYRLEVRPSNRLTAPVKTWRNDDGRYSTASERLIVGVTMEDNGYVWGISTGAATEHEARASREGVGSKYDYVSLSWAEHFAQRGEQLTIQQFNGHDELLTWVSATEDHS